MSKIAYFFLLNISLGSIPFSSAMEEEPNPMISFRFGFKGDTSNDKVFQNQMQVYDRIKKGLKKAGLLEDSQQDVFGKESFKIEKKALTSSQSNKMDAKELYDKLGTILLKAYAPYFPFWYVKFNISESTSGGDGYQVIDEKRGSEVELKERGLSVNVLDLKYNNKVVILGIVTLVSISLIFYLYFFKKSVKEALSEQKINKEASLEEHTVQVEAQ